MMPLGSGGKDDVDPEEDVVDEVVI